MRLGDRCRGGEVGGGRRGGGGRYGVGVAATALVAAGLDPVCLPSRSVFELPLPVVLVVLVVLVALVALVEGGVAPGRAAMMPTKPQQLQAVRVSTAKTAMSTCAMRGSPRARCQRAGC